MNLIVYKWVRGKVSLIRFISELQIIMANQDGGWGAPCYTGGQCGALLACVGDAANVGGKRTNLKGRI